MTNQTPPPDTTGARDHGRRPLAELIARLVERYSADPPAFTSSDHARRLAGLRLADAALRDLAALDRQPVRPLQLAVLGPTQAGKSTLVNLLLGGLHAHTSALAGFTVHPTGFGVALADPGLDWLSPLFAGWERVAPAQLSRARLDAYALLPLPPVTGLTADLVLWDTPDFDSVKAHSYQRGVLEVAALADAVLLVLSKEKYADLSVWSFLELLEPLGRPLLICLNKMTVEAEQPIVESLRARLTERNIGTDSTLALLPQHADIDRLPADHPARTALLDEVRRALERAERRRRAAGVHQLLVAHWEAWTAPVVSELAARAEWQSVIDAAVTRALDAYRVEFLDHPQRFDTFRRTVAELLQLLELPGIAQTLARVRQMLTWPARQLFASTPLRKLTGRAHGAHAELPNEERILQDVFEHLLTTLSRDVLRNAEPNTPAAAFWQALGRRLAERHQDLLHRFAGVARRHHQEFQPEIEAAAHQLYETLQHKPALLNSLRAARVTTDAAAVALAVKTGGLGVNDLLFAPAMVALTSMLTEGAVGTYMQRVAGQLKERQYARVSAQVFAGSVEPALRALADALEAAGLFGIDEQSYQAAERALEDWAP